MKLVFNPNLDFQNEAIASIVDIFNGQEHIEGRFSVSNPDTEKDLFNPDQITIGYGNKLILTDEELYNNVIEIQRRNKLPVSDPVEVKENRFCIEMETGTGKTYVYLKTIMELHQKFTFRKFIIVVPSISIREGVLKSLEITKAHFQQLYNNTPFHFFVYDSKKPNMISEFAKSQNLEIMVINIQAFNSEDNIINNERDNSTVSPMQLIAQTNPIVIVDEPQSTSNSEKAKKAIAKFNPMVQLDYSATHTEPINTMFSLNAVEAYNRKLVKQIEVASVTPEGFFNHPYVVLKGFSGGKTIQAKLEVHTRNRNGDIQTKVINVKNGQNLQLLTGNDIYDDNFTIDVINREKGKEYVSFLNGQFVTYDESINHFPETEIKRLQIRRTITEHLDKEKKLNKQGLKVLSLFFIDKVEKYRVYTDEETEHGEYAKIFEEEYKNLIKLPQYRDLFQDEIKDLDRHVSEVHNGYFAKDKKSGQFKDIKETASSINSKDAGDAFHAIMKDKEGLLSFGDEFANKIRFIFSHSALKEGWDNPNVFQICTLKEAGKSETRRRQEIGRGLRLAVNQEGQRVYGHDVNLLTVMASESYEHFTKGLQGEMEQASGSKFGVVSKDDFSAITYTDENDKLQNVNKNQSAKLWGELKENGYLSNQGKVTDTLKQALKEKTVVLPDFFQTEEIKLQVYNLLTKKAGSLEIKNRDERKTLKVKKEVLLSDDFKAIWDKIKYKTYFEVDYDIEKLKDDIARAIKDRVRVFDGKLIFKKVSLKIDESGIETVEEADAEYNSKRDVDNIPNIISFLQEQINLTRRTIIEILEASETVHMIKRNPQIYAKSVLSIFRDIMSKYIVDGIKYHKLGDSHFYKQELFEDEELHGFLEKNMRESTKSPYDYVIYDSNIESELVREFEISENVKFYTKLPSWFKIPTPLGSYNPDWAVVWEENKEKKVYFVCESKGSTQLEMDLKGVEKGKIKCGTAHFKELADVKFETIKEIKDLSKSV